jgi:nitrite reductase/ring-hydroxylating ferredoxin subunit
MTAPAQDAVRVCAAEELVDGGAGVRVPATEASGYAVVFFVRYDGKPHGYLNRCAHVPMELDWNEGQFFESSGLYLMCATHGAIYEPDTGKCVGGPCRGARLRPVTVEERDTPEGRAVFWLPSQHVHHACPTTFRRAATTIGSATRSNASRLPPSASSAPRGAGVSSFASCFLA